MADSRTSKEKETDDFVNFLRDVYRYKHIYIVEDISEHKAMVAICQTETKKVYFVTGQRLYGTFASIHLPATLYK